MNALPWYKAYPRDFLEGSAGLSLELKGAYRLILDLIYLHNGALRAGSPDEERYIAGQLGCSLRKARGILEVLVSSGKLDLNDGIISNKRAEKEMEISRLSQEKQAENARGPRKNKDLEKPRQTDTDTDTDKKIKNKKSSSKARGPIGFSEGERREAREVAEWISAGNSINPDGVPRRVRDCLISERMLSHDELVEAGLLLRN